MSDQHFALTFPPELVEAIAERVVELLADSNMLDRRSEPWMDVESAARYMACKPARLYDLVSQDRLKAGRDGRRLAFHRGDLDRYLRGDEAAA